MRAIGTMLSGRRLGDALAWAFEHGFTAAEIPVLKGTQHQVPRFEDVESFLEGKTGCPVFGSSNLPAFGAKFKPKHEKALQVCQTLGLAGYIVPSNEALTDYVTPDLRGSVLLIRNGGLYVTTALVKGLRAAKADPETAQVGLAYDIAAAWVAGEASPFQAFEKWVDLVRPYLEVLILENVALGTPFGGQVLTRVPIMAGEVAPVHYVKLLKAFPETPVLVRASIPAQAVMDRCLVQHMEGKPHRYINLPPGSGPHAGLEETVQ